MIFGRLDRKISIYRPTFSQDGYGEQVRTNSLYKNAWARIYFQTSGSKTEYEADSFIGSAKIDFLVRYDESITIKDYIVYRGDNYYIQEVQELGRKEGLKLKTIKKEDIN